LLHYIFALHFAGEQKRTATGAAPRGHLKGKLMGLPLPGQSGYRDRNCVGRKGFACAYARETQLMSVVRRNMPSLEAMPVRLDGPGRGRGRAA
jgi:hypothetical protein